MGVVFVVGAWWADLRVEAWIAGLAPLPFQAAPYGSTRYLVIDFKLAYHRF